MLFQAQIYYDEGDLESAFILDNKFLTYVDIRVGLRKLLQLKKNNLKKKLKKHMYG